jgi:hypothetical protein
MLEDPQPLLDRVASWLANEGYPLEFAAASQFQSAGFDVRQGQYVRDPDDGLREIDLTATVTAMDGDSMLRVHQLIECAASRDKPWVIFIGPGRFATSALITQGIASRTASTLLWVRAGDLRLQQMALFHTPDFPAFNGRQAFGDKDDAFHHAVQSVVSKATLLAADYDEPTEDIDRLLKVAVVVFPIVVVDGPLIEASFNADAQKLQLREVPHLRIHWRALASWTGHATVDIVSASAVPAFATERGADTFGLMTQLALGLKQLHQCRDAKSFKPLETTEGSRGTVAMTPLLKQIHAEFRH